MREWLYRASSAKTGPEATQELADKFGFICRSAFAEAAKEQMIANVGKVDFGDVIHLYYVDEAGGRSLGAFRLVGPHRHPHGEYFGGAVPRTRLRRVAVGPLQEQLQQVEGYEPDPRLQEFCGWPVVQEERSSPIYVRDLFPGRNSLVPR